MRAVRTKRARPTSRLARRLERFVGDPANLLQLLVTLLMAMVLLGAGLMSSEASGEWQQALRDDIKRSAAALEDIRSVYTDEAMPAFRIAVAEVRAAELRLSSSSSGTAARYEADTESQAAAQLRFAHRGSGSLVDGKRYQSDDHSFNIPDRLADMRAKRPELVRLDPGTTRKEADAMGTQAFLLSCAVFPLVGLYLIVQFAVVRRRTRKKRAEDAGLAPEPVGADARRVTVSVALLSWMALTLLVPFQLRAANQEQQSQAAAAQYANRVSGSIEASNIAAAFAVDSTRVAIELDVRSETRRYALIDATPAEAAEQAPIVRADARTVARVKQIAQVMSRTPGTADGVDAATVSLIDTGLADWRRLGEEQGRLADLAERAGKRNTLLTIAIVFAAFAQSLSAFAGVIRPKKRERLWRWCARGLLIVCALIAVTAAFT